MELPMQSCMKQNCMIQCCYRIVQPPTHCGDFFREPLPSSSAAAIASSNAFLTFSFLRAEHSTYVVALISDASLMPSDLDRVFSPRDFSSFVIEESSLLSICVPTRMIGTPGQCRLISLDHFVLTFSQDSKSTTEKQIRTASSLGQHRGLKCAKSSCPDVSQRVTEILFPYTEIDAVKRKREASHNGPLESG